MDKNTEIETLKRQVIEAQLILKEAIIQLDQQAEQIEKLTKRNKELEQLLSKSVGKPPQKDSSNSNLPPSKDLPRPDRRRSLRPKSDRKTGGQPGHKGHTLEFNPNPDQIIDLINKNCSRCGLKLDQNKASRIGARQQIDIPTINTFTKQFNIYQTKCKCGCINESTFPYSINAPTQYGPNTRALINYLSVRQYIPYYRITELLKHCFNLSLSQGTIYNTLERTVRKTNGIYQTIKDFLQQSDWVGSDETGIYVNGKNWYNWVWQNKKATFIVATPTKRKDHISEYFYHGFPNAILSSDQYAAQLSTIAKGHQICYPHLYRRIVYLMEIEPNKWLVNIKKILKKAEALKQLKPQRARSNQQAKYLETKLNRLLINKIDQTNFPESFTFQNSLIKHRHAILTFLYHKKVPADNNDSEKAIRNAKVKMKVSGFFKSQQQTFAQLRSIIDTLIKNNTPILPALQNIEQGNDIALGWYRPE